MGLALVVARGDAVVVGLRRAATRSLPQERETGCAEDSSIAAADDAGRVGAVIKGVGPGGAACRVARMGGNADVASHASLGRLARSPAGDILQLSEI